MLLPYTVKFTRGILDVLQRTAGEDTILELLIIGLDVEIDLAVALVGKAIVDDLLHQLLLLDDMARSVRFNRGAQHIQRIHRSVVTVGVILGNLHRLQLFQPGLLGDLVLTLVGIMFQMAHIGDVTHITYLITQMLQIAEHQVEGDGRTGVPQMGIAIDGGTTDIHAYIGCVERLKTLLLTRQRIVNNQF